jgi:hypothetical protein
LAGLFALSIVPVAANVRFVGPFVTPHTVKYTYIGFPKNNSIQDSLVNTFPHSMFKTTTTPAIPFDITGSSDKCGTESNTGTFACNYYSFGFNAANAKIIIKMSIPGATTVYSMMNAFQPISGKQLAYIVFYGSKGAKAAFKLVGGSDIRDFYQGGFTNTLSNSVAGVKTSNIFTCVDPKTCIGAGGTGNVATGNTGTYVVDMQAYTLPAEFLTQNLTEIGIVDACDCSSPILLGLTVAS